MSDSKSDKKILQTISLVFLTLVIIAIPIIAFYVFYKTDKHIDKVEKPYFDGYTNTSEELAAALFDGSKELIDPILEADTWKDTETAYYHNEDTNQTDALITFKSQAIKLDFPKLLNKYDGSYVVSKYTNHGETRFNINPKRVVGSSYEFSPESVTWMSTSNILYNGKTQHIGNGTLETSTIFSFPNTGVTSSLDLADTVFNYELFYNASPTSNFYIKNDGVEEFIYEDYTKAFLFNDESMIVRYAMPVGNFKTDYDWSNYNDLDNVILVENKSDEDDIYILDLTNSSEPEYFESEEDYQDALDSQGEQITTIYDFMEAYGVDEINDSIVEYIDVFPTILKSMFGLSGLVEQMLVSQQLETYVVENVYAYKIENLKEQFKQSLLDKFDNLTAQQQQTIQAIILALNAPLSTILEFVSEIVDWLVEQNYDALISIGFTSIINEISDYSVDELNNLFDKLNDLSKATMIQFINMLQNEYNQSTSLVQTQQKIYEWVIERAIIDTIPSVYLNAIINNPDFELSTEISSEIVYFYTTSDQSKYFGFDIKTWTLFTPEVEDLQNH